MRETATRSFYRDSRPGRLCSNSQRISFFNILSLKQRLKGDSEIEDPVMEGRLVKVSRKGSRKSMKGVLPDMAERRGHWKEGRCVRAQQSRISSTTAGTSMELPPKIKQRSWRDRSVVKGTSRGPRSNFQYRDA